ncbi:hypothetical protein DYB35_004904 [Aphanomyces astaci]|uniref:EF-hand domain-containing protein n=1 Tax=Aphanomyces astaci TaxID=112090 RepID=A0A3R6ZHC9_APHAT|nr:hypothetical protein DYB35_004904 [Aphanomyces astaci]
MKPIIIDEDVEIGDVAPSSTTSAPGNKVLIPHNAGSPKKKEKHPPVYRSHSIHTSSAANAAYVHPTPHLQPPHTHHSSTDKHNRSATMSHIPMIKHKRPKPTKSNHHKTHDPNWDVSILNKSWQISDDMRRSLPALVQNNLRMARGASAPSADQRFLSSTKLVVPALKAMGIPTSAEVLQAQLLMDEVKNDALEKLTDSDRRKYRPCYTITSSSYGLLQVLLIRYFGESGKSDMGRLTNKLASQMYLFTSVEDLLDTNIDMTQLEPSDDTVGIFAGPLTARHKYTAMCLIAKLPPSIRLMIRNHTGPEINVSHMAMGDDMCKIFAQCLADLPMVTSLNVRNNRLTDSGIGALVYVCLNKDDLTSLDLSENKVDGDAAAALAEYVAAPTCALTELRMNKSDVDDGEVLGFAQALHTNTSLRTLELSRNLIGSAEMMNVVKPDMITGGEAIAEMLCNNSFLTKLDLSWNTIRLNSHNNIPCQAAWVIAQSLQVNDSISTIILDGNPLGKLGCQGLLQAVATSSNRSLSIPMNGCNFDLFDPNSFNPEEASGQYDLNLSNKARMFAARMNQTTLESLFDELDKDHSGAIDSIELENGMLSMGIEPEVGEAARLISRFDIDGTGTRPHLMASFNVVPTPKRVLVDVATNRPFEVPLTGHMLVEFVDLHIPSEQQEAHTRESVGHLIKNLKDNHSHVQMLAMAKNEREAQMIIDSILDGSDVVQAMASILPHMIDASNACQLIECNITDVSQRLRLQHLLRFSFGPIVGLCTGHYRLEMAEPLDRIAAKKLMEISNKTMLWKKRHDLLDTSQHRNFQCFRNECFNGKPVVLGQADIQPMSTKRFQQFLDKMQTVGLDVNPHCQVPHCYRVLSENVYTQVLKMQKNRQHIHYGAGLAAVSEATLLGEKTTISVRRLIMELHSVLSSRWISVKQTIRFLTMWPRVFQAARLDVILIFFDRITDVYNFQQVLPLLTDDEVAQLLYRVGWLHVWSPLVPDLYYELDLSMYEQREVAKILVQLALNEPVIYGENWQNETYGWNRGDPIPGWQLNQSWLGEGNFPEKGYLTLDYYSGADRGCGPVWHTRMALCKHVLAEPPPPAHLNEFIHHTTILTLNSIRDLTPKPVVAHSIQPKKKQ